MHTKLRKLVPLTLALLLALVTVMPAAADAIVTVTGGSLAVTPQDVTFSVTLNGADQTVVGATSAWSATDPTGTGAGWHVNIQATNFSTMGFDPQTIPVSNFQVKLADANITPLAGNTAPTSKIATYTALSTTDQVLLGANLDEGRGTYDFTPDFQLLVPAQTKTGTYNSAVTVTIVSGP